MQKIEIFDAAGKPLASLDRSACKRASMQAASDHKKMDAFAAENPAAATAKIAIGESTTGEALSYDFIFVKGRSRAID